MAVFLLRQRKKKQKQNDYRNGFFADNGAFKHMKNNNAIQINSFVLRVFVHILKNEFRLFICFSKYCDLFSVSQQLCVEVNCVHFSFLPIVLDHFCHTDASQQIELDFNLFLIFEEFPCTSAE